MAFTYGGTLISNARVQRIDGGKFIFGQLAPTGYTDSLRDVTSVYRLVSTSSPNAYEMLDGSGNQVNIELNGGKPYFPSPVFIGNPGLTRSYAPAWATWTFSDGGNGNVSFCSVVGSCVGVDPTEGLQLVNGSAATFAVDYRGYDCTAACDRSQLNLQEGEVALFTQQQYEGVAGIFHANLPDQRLPGRKSHGRHGRRHWDHMGTGHRGSCSDRPEHRHEHARVGCDQGNWRILLPGGVEHQVEPARARFAGLDRPSPPARVVELGRRGGGSTACLQPRRTGADRRTLHGVAYLSRSQEICGQCNGRCLNALAQVDDRTPAVGALDALSARAATADGRTVRPFNPLARQERTLFEVLMSGEHTLHGFTNRELREHLVRVGYPLAADAAKHSGQVTRLLRRLHIHQLIAKIPRSRRWRVSRNGRRVMAAAIKLREVEYPSLYAEAA